MILFHLTFLYYHYFQINLLINLFLETPNIIGNPSEWKIEILFNKVILCFKFLPKPIPGSKIILLCLIPIDLNFFYFFFKKIINIQKNIFISWIFLHIFWCSLHMMNNKWDFIFFKILIVFASYSKPETSFIKFTLFFIPFSIIQLLRVSKEINLFSFLIFLKFY